MPPTWCWLQPPSSSSRRAPSPPSCMRPTVFSPLEPSLLKWVIASHSGWLWQPVIDKSLDDRFHDICLNSTKLKSFLGVLCTVIGVLVVIMNFSAPEKMKEAFSVAVDSCEDEDISYGETYLNSAFLDDVTVSPCTFTEVTVVSILYIQFIRWSSDDISSTWHLKTQLNSTYIQKFFFWGAPFLYLEI